ncbi:hypothetical protein GCM10009720_11210 [Yaniella flava]|uniref:DNA modification methylase n=1 Tax=Yaniella flava TaxID=287930 RepID=A0ABP5FS16_9MICC
MKVNNTRRNVFAGLAVAAILGTTGCSVVNPQATTFEYAPSDGTQTTVAGDEAADANSDHVRLVNIGVITNSADEPGRLMGSIDNRSDSNQTVDLEINNQTLSFSLDAGEILKLDDEEVIVDSVGTEPGLLAEGVASAFGNESEFNVSVLPPTLEEYRELYPGDVDVEEQIEHLYEFQGQHHDEE